MTCRRAFSTARLIGLIGVFTVIAGGEVSGCRQAASEAPAGGAPATAAAPVVYPSTAPGHVMGAMRAAQMMKAARQQNGGK